MKRLLLLALALLACLPANAEVIEAPDVLRDVNAIAGIRRDILCHGPQSLVAAATTPRRLAADLSSSGARVVVLRGTSSLALEADAKALMHLTASATVRSLHRIGRPGGVEALPSVDALRAAAGASGGAAVIATLAVNIPPDADETARRDIIARAAAGAVKGLAGKGVADIRTFDLSPLVAMTVNAQGLEALLTSTAVCSVTEDAVSQPMGGGSAK